MPTDRDVRRQTPVGGVPAATAPGDEPHETIRLARAARDTSRVTADRVDELRGEVNQRFMVMEGHIGDLRETAGNLCGKVDILVDELRSDRDERRQLRITDVQARIEVTKTAQLATITEGQKDRGWWREVGLKAVVGIIGGIGAIGTLVISLILAGRC